MNYFLSLLLVFAISAAGAATPPAISVPPRLVVSTATEKPVTLEGVKIATDIRGSLAVTSVEMRFFNPNARQLEGELQFPLLDGQRVIGMAMDVNGALRDAVPVDRTRGQEVFEEVTRGQIDPALLQVTQGNNYKLRVFPILPGAYKTVVIRYMEALPRNGNRHVYRLPLGYAERLAAFDLTITVTEKPTDQRGAESVGQLAFERSGRFYTARVTREKFAARGVLELALPSADRPQVYTQMLDGRTYFYAEVPVAGVVTARTLPRSIGVIWDASGSGAQRDHTRELALLEAYFQKVRNVEVRLARVRDAAEPAESFSVRNGDWRALRRALESTVYDGATNLGAFVPEAKSPIQEYLLFTDGLRNFGGGDLPLLRVPVYTISSSTQNDPAWLAQVAHRSGGRYINLVSDTPADAAKHLLSHATRIVSLDSRGASQVVTASPFPENGLIRIAGVATGARPRLQLEVSAPGAASRTIDVEVAPDTAESPFAALMWASLRVGELDADYRLNRAEIRRIGKAFGLTTRETSLIVLDRIEDYVRFEIVPPAKLRAEYDGLMRVAQQRMTVERRSQLERVVRLFGEKKSWWAREFPKRERPPQAAISKEEDRRRSTTIGIRALEAQDAASARSAPSAPAPARAERRADAPAEMAAGGAATGGPTASTPDIGIQLRRWTPDAPYIARFASAQRADLYRTYLDERPGYASSTAFFVDAADQLIEKGETDLGVRVLSNLAEMDLENRHVLRILGYRLLQVGKPRLAIPVFQQVLELSPEEPQSYRDLGLAYAADKQYQKAIDAFYEVVTRPWHARFPEVELIAIAELNAIVAEAKRAHVALDMTRVDPRLLANLAVDVRVILTWDADNTDIDLWVTDPNGEKAYYGNRLSYQGGRMSPDFTGGYGPEEFSLRKAKPGKYLVQVNFFGHRRQTVSGATTLQMKLVTGFGTDRQQERVTTLRLRERSEMVTIGEFEVGGIHSSSGEP